MSYLSWRKLRAKRTPAVALGGGAEGQAFWDKAKADWIARHPLVGRVEGDPGYEQLMARIGEPANP